MKRRFVIYRDGVRYWASKSRRNGKKGLKFWSSHPWPFWHASYYPDVMEREDCWQKFMDFTKDAR